MLIPYSMTSNTLPVLTFFFQFGRSLLQFCLPQKDFSASVFTVKATSHCACVGAIKGTDDVLSAEDSPYCTSW